MPLWLVLVLLAFGTHRLTRIVTSDSITAGLRTRWFIRFPPIGARHHPLGELVDCPWCIGWWLSGLLVGAATWSGLLPRRAWVGWLVWPAVASVAGLLARNLDSEPDE